MNDSNTTATDALDHMIGTLTHVDAEIDKIVSHLLGEDESPEQVTDKDETP